MGKTNSTRKKNHQKRLNQISRPQINAFNELSLKAEDLLADSKDTITIKSIKFLLYIGPKCTLYKNNLPKMFKLVSYFCAKYGIIWKKEIPIEDDNSLKTTTSEITAATENQAEKNRD